LLGWSSTRLDVNPQILLDEGGGTLDGVELRLELQDGGLEKGSGSLLNFLLKGELLRS
jgi:hypothetical protein